MNTVSVEIPAPHGKAIAERKAIMQSVIAQFQVMRAEDKRHVDAVLETLGHTADDYQTYDLTIEKDHFFLVLTPKAADAAAVPQAVPAAVPHTVNGAPLPPV